MPPSLPYTHPPPLGRYTHPLDSSLLSTLTRSSIVTLLAYHPLCTPRFSFLPSWRNLWLLLLLSRSILLTTKSFLGCSPSSAGPAPCFPRCMPHPSHSKSDVLTEIIQANHFSSRSLAYQLRQGLEQPSSQAIIHKKTPSDVTSIARLVKGSKRVGSRVVASKKTPTSGESECAQ